ncbi:MAG: aldehyde dehydrogenase [Pseudomonadota bacterium]
MQTYQHYINGAYVDPAQGQWFDSHDPYRGEVWAQMPRGTAADVDAAVAAAKAALDGPYGDLTASARGKLMRRLGDLVAENADRLAEIEVRDNGKLLSEMAGQMRYHPEWWYYFAGLADKVEGSVIPIDKPNHLAFTRHEPVGVVGAITAWNSPLLFVAWKCAPAIAAGCTVVIKPSEFTSASTLEYAALVKEAGFPEGVFNVVAGMGAEAGAALVDHPDVAKITFTGSDKTGAMIYSQAAKHIKRVSLELGGKSPNVIFDDANLDAACAGAVSGIFAATGQTCIAGSRLLVQNSVRDAVEAKMVEIARTAKIGDPMKAETNIGPVTTAPQYAKIREYIGVAESEGAKLLFGGGTPQGPEIQGGQFVEPTIFTGVLNSMRIAQEEVFGPVLSIIGFEDEDEAVEIGNDIAFGLAAGVWTQNIGRAVRMSERLKAGTVWVNTYRAVSYMMPFGGVKRSGIGRESGVEAIREYLSTKSVWINTSDEAPGNPFVMR